MRPIYNKVEMSLSEGENTAEAKVFVDPGKRVYVRAVAKPALNKIVKVGMLENGSEIHPFMDVSHYDGGIGSFEQRALELPYRGGSEITVKMQLNEALAAGEKLEAEIVFLTYQEEECD